MLWMVPLALAGANPLDNDFARWFLNAPGIVSQATSQRRRELIQVWLTRSPALRQHQELANGYQLDTATANVIYECRLRSGGWLVQVENRIRRTALSNARLNALGRRLSSDEIEAERAYLMWASVLHREFLLRGRGCANLVGMPYLQRFDAMSR